MAHKALFNGLYVSFFKNVPLNGENVLPGLFLMSFLSMPCCALPPVVVSLSFLLSLYKVGFIFTSMSV